MAAATATTPATAPVPGPAAAPETGEQRFVLTAVDWPSYLKIADGIGERRVRATYDGARLELMTTSPRHETWKRSLGRMVEAMCEELGIDIACFGSFTMQREDVARGMEPDEGYYIANEPAVRGRLDLDLAHDPPPDLVIEVEVSRSLLDRLAILAALGVREVWRFDGQTLSISVLNEHRRYVTADRSSCFPFLPVNEFAAYARMRDGMGDSELLRTVRAWVRDRVAPLAGGNPT